MKTLKANKFKIGDGVRRYLDLPYAYSGGSSGGGSLIISATAPIGTEGGGWLSTNTGIRYTFLNNKWVEV